MKLSMDEEGLREMRDNMAAAAKIVKLHHAGGGDIGLPQVTVTLLCPWCRSCRCSISYIRGVFRRIRDLKGEPSLCALETLYASTHVRVYEPFLLPHPPAPAMKE